MACGRPASTDEGVAVEWRMTPDAPEVDREIAITFTLLDAARRPVPGATLDIEGHMSHPGMAPVVVRASERGGGVYDARVTFTMSGDWILFVTGTRPGGQVIRHRAADVTVRLAE